jgi:hypothetical protein
LTRIDPDIDVNRQAAEAIGMAAVRFRTTDQAIAGVEAALAAAVG